VGLALAAAGMDVTFLTRRPVPAIGPVRALPAGHRSLPRGRAVFVLAVPDHSIVPVLQDLASRGIVTSDSFVGHLSGALGSAILARPEGLAGVFSSHPLHAFPPPSPPRPMPAGTLVTVEGDGPGTACARLAFTRAGARVATIPASAKPLYHAAAVIASNLPAVLLWTASDLLRKAGIPDPVATTARLVGSFASNVTESPGMSSVTGPFVRADASTIASNLAALAATSPEAADLYRRLGVALSDRLRDERILSEAAWKTVLETLK
jgi:predicted short-subunit dehydrogenase-like oxidoreductase (DUF2520 family)